MDRRTQDVSHDSRSLSQPIEDSDSEENSELGQSEDEDEKPQKQMHLGRFCAKRTQSFHEFTHWEVSRMVAELDFFL